MALPKSRPVREDLSPLITRTATGLFAERGFEATTMNDIAAGVGITAAGLYYYFDSKQSLLFEVLRSALDGLIDRLTPAVVAASAGGAPAQLRAFCRVHVGVQVEEVAGTAVYGAVFYGSRHMLNALTDAQRARLRELQDRVFDMLRAILQRGVLSGEFRIREVTPTAFAIVGIGEYAPAWFKPAGPLSTEELAELHGALALRMAGIREDAAGGC